jgi:hypothetical protein
MNVSPRYALAGIAAAATWSVSYVVQRLASAWFGEVNPKLILATEHIPFFWRLTLGGVHALTAGVLVAALVEDEVAARWLDRAAAAMVVLTVLGAVAMVGVP